MKIAIRTFLAAWLLISSVATIFEWGTLSKVKAQRDDLVLRVLETERSLEQRERSNASGGPLPDSVEKELLRLRNEIGRLRNLSQDLERLRNENAQLRALIAPDTAKAAGLQ